MLRQGMNDLRFSVQAGSLAVWPRHPCHPPPEKPLGHQHNLQFRASGRGHDLLLLEDFRRGQNAHEPVSADPHILFQPVVPPAPNPLVPKGTNKSRFR